CLTKFIMRSKGLLFINIVLLSVISTYAQHTIKLSIKSKEEKIPLAGATAIITPINKTSVADSLGMATFTNVAAGNYKIKISFVGMEEKQADITVPQSTGEPVEVLLEEEEGTEEEVIITSTRTSRSIS